MNGNEREGELPQISHRWTRMHADSGAFRLFTFVRGERFRRSPRNLGVLCVSAVKAPVPNPSRDIY